MQRWEHQCVEVVDADYHTLSVVAESATDVGQRMGAAGWEMTLPMRNGQVICFKRPLR